MAAGCAVVVLAGHPAVRAEDDRAVDDVPPAVAQMHVPQENWINLGENFDANVLQQTGGFSLTGGRRGAMVQRPGTPEPDAPAEASLESPTLAALRRLGDARLARIDAACGLSDPQRRKLRLATESDIRRVAEEIDFERRKYEGLKVNFGFGDPAGQRQWQQFQQDVQRCRERMQGLFAADSLLMKVLPTTLDSEQHARLVAETEARRACRWKGLVTFAMSKFDDQLGLDQRQYEELEKLLLEKQPPLRLEGFASPQNQHVQQMLVPMVLAEIDGQRLQAIVSARQSKLLAQFANQGKSMRSHIEAQGLLEKVSK